MLQPVTIAGVVLAAGRSSRMGVPKALLDFRGQPFVIRILEAFEALDLKTCAVVVGPDAPRIRPTLAGHDCVVVENPDVDGGPIVSLRCALAVLQPARPAAVLAWPVDLPHVRITTVERLIEVYRRSHPAAVVPAFAGRRGHPVIWDAALFTELESSDAATREGARAVLHAHDAEVSTVSIDDPAVCDDLNTPQDYERLIRVLNRDIY
jgi:CTP:molybdopterin cytidylyltransferase MocA